jgi:hypothetical protein
LQAASVVAQAIEMRQLSQSLAALMPRSFGDSGALPLLEGHHEGGTREVVVINDGTNTMTVFCWLGDTLNGVTNGSLDVPAGSVGS